MLWSIAPKSGSDTSLPAEISLGIRPIKAGIVLRWRPQNCDPPHIPLEDLYLKQRELE